MPKKEIIINQILEKINSLDVAWYLKEDVEKYLEYFHSYKLNNILKNIDFLCDYLSFLDQKNTKQIDALSHDFIDDIDIWAHDLNYYVSKEWLGIVWEQKLKQKIIQNDYNLNSVMLWIKWFLLLTMDEFCNATPVRLSIDQILWHREIWK